MFVRFAFASIGPFFLFPSFTLTCVSTQTLFTLAWFLYKIMHESDIMQNVYSFFEYENKLYLFVIILLQPSLCIYMCTFIRLSFFIYHIEI